MSTSTESVHQALRRGTECELRFDDLTRQLYATDASIYRIEPVGVAFPRSAVETASLFRAAADAGVSLIPRGAGTGLAGGAVGDGLVVDFARYNRKITEFNREARTVRAGPGVVLDQLNAYLKPHGLWFGPDVATSSRATIGGMVANNSSGAHVPAYGTTVDHVHSLEVVLPDGTIAEVGRDCDGLAQYRDAVDRLVASNADVIRERLPEGLPKRWPGYGFDDCLRERRDLTRLFTGSEGTLCAITSSVLDLVPLPARKGLGVLFFASVADAMEATVELLDLSASAIEHIDRLLFDQTRGQIAFAEARALLRLNEEPCEALLLVEFFEDVDDKLAILAKRNLGVRKLILTDPREMELVWAVRKAGLSLLTGCKGSAKPTPGVEDVCVRPERLPEYVKGLRRILDPLGIEASYYGHAAAGELHVRPKLNLHTAEDVAKYRKIADEVSALCKEFKGSLAAEHGVGIARTEYLADHLGPKLMDASRQIKALFDPMNRLNPGKLIGDGTFRIDANLRLGGDYHLDLPFEPVLGFVEKDGSFTANLEQCNGCGGCRKDGPTMCPTYIATGEEIMSTRGRANTIRATLEGHFGDDDPLFGEELDKALSNCLSCKACKTECPSNVDLALLKAELLHAKHERRGVPLVDRMIAQADRLGRLGTATAPVSNWALRWSVVRWMMEKTLGFARQRELPPYTWQRFDRWFAARQNHRPAPRGRVILWDDTWVRYHEPNIGQAAVRVLEAAGFEVVLAEDRVCCGRPAMSRGVLDDARAAGEHNVAMFARAGGDEPILFLEASCYAMFIDEYRQFGIPGADDVARRCRLFEQFMFDLLEREPDALPLQRRECKVAIHGHCHAKALSDASVMPRLARRIPGAEAQLLATACCGMAGAFGMLKEKYELSLQVGRDLADKLNALPPGTHVVASGTSCRHQITHMTAYHPLHMAELLAMAL